VKITPTRQLHGRIPGGNVDFEDLLKNRNELVGRRNCEVEHAAPFGPVQNGA